MKKLFYTATVVAISALSFAFTPKGDKYTVDSKVSSLEWTGKKVTGQHNGTINVDGGEIMVEDGKIVGGMVSINMNSIAVTDIKDEEMNGKLKGHLMSDDFFGVDVFFAAFGLAAAFLALGFLTTSSTGSAKSAAV